MLDGYTKYRNHTIDHTKVDSDLVDFPVLVKLTTTNFDFDHCRTDGKDNRFTQADDTLLKHEVERFDNANEKAEFFVKIPAVSSAGDTVIKHQYDKSDEASDGADPTNVWDANAKMVQHMNQDPSGSAPQMIDSTGNDNDGTSGGAMNSGDLVEGKIGKCLDFDGVNDYVDCGSDASLDITDAITIEAWVKADDLTDRPIVSKSVSSESAPYHQYHFFINSGENLGFAGDLDGTYRGIIANDVAFTSGWHHVAVSWDEDYARLYTDGLEIANDNTYSGQSLQSHSTWPVRIGNVRYSIASWAYFNGAIDSVRIYNRALSAAWTKADYNSGNDTLLSYGSEVSAVCISDTGVGSETGIIDRNFESVSVLSKVGVADNGQGTESLEVLIQAALTDTGAGADAVSVGGNVKEVTDSGSGSEALNILVGMSITDTGVGTEIINILNQIILTDTGSGADAITVLGQIAISDTCAGSEALEVLTNIAVSDSGLGTEALSVLSQLAITDSGAGVEVLDILNQLAIAETGSGADSIDKTILDTRTVTDSGTGADVVAFAKQILMTDSGVGADSVAKQKITAAIATILSALDKNANIKFTGQTKQPIIKLTNQVKARIKNITNN